MKKLILLLLFLPVIVFAQVTFEKDSNKEIQIEGNVRDVNGVSLSGVSVLLKGGSNEIKSNFDGNFNLKVEEGDVLIVSYTGFKTKEIPIGNQIKMNITLGEEVTSETKRALTKSDIRKKRQAKKKAKRQRNYRPNPESLDDWAKAAVGRSVLGAIRKNVKN